LFLNKLIPSICHSTISSKLLSNEISTSNWWPATNLCWFDPSSFWTCAVQGYYFSDLLRAFWHVQYKVTTASVIFIHFS